MTAYLNKSFSVGTQNTDSFRDGHERTFGPRKLKAKCGHSIGETTSYYTADGSVLETCRVCEAVGRGSTER